MKCPQCGSESWDFSLWVAYEDGQVTSSMWSPEVACQSCDFSFYADEVDPEYLKDERIHDPHGHIAWFASIADSMPEPRGNNRS